MKFSQLQSVTLADIFTISDVVKLFPYENKHTIKVQLQRFIQNGQLIRIKRGLYSLKEKSLDEFAIANRLYQPSYISLESALNYYGIIPDVPQQITSVTYNYPKLITTSFGSFAYHKVKNELFYGFTRKKLSAHSYSILFAREEKALLDYVYIRRITKTDDLRLVIVPI